MLHKLLSRASSPSKPEYTQSETSGDQRRLLACLIDEARTALVLTGVTASTLNASVRQPEMLARMPAFVPSGPIVFPTVKAGLIEGVRARQLVETDRFFRHLSLAKSRLAGLPPEAGLEERADVAKAWRALCSIGDLAMPEINVLIGPAEAEELHLSDDIRRLLIAVGDGASPCQLDGRPELPAWFQRRHHPRMRASLVAELTCGDTSARVLILDVSVGGCGLDQAPALPVDAEICLRLDTGRRLDGRVRWQNGARAGVLFSRQLSFTDPLVSAG